MNAARREMPGIDHSPELLGQPNECYEWLERRMQNASPPYAANPVDFPQLTEKKMMKHGRTHLVAQQVAKFIVTPWNWSIPP